MARRYLSIATWQGEVDIDVEAFDTKYAKGASDALDAAELLENLLQLGDLEAKDLDIVLVRSEPEETVTNGSPDDDGATSGRVDCRCYLADDVG
jgi:hypothetical protein